MITTSEKHSSTFMVCKRCGYLVASNEEYCEACKNHKDRSPNLALW